MSKMNKTPLTSFMRSTLETTICKRLEKGYLKEGVNYINVIKEYPIPGARKRIDYKATDFDRHDVFIEVKTWEITMKHVLQIIGYYLHLKPNKFYKNPRFIIIGKTITDFKREVLGKLGIEVQLLNEILS